MLLQRVLVVLDHLEQAFVVALVGEGLLYLFLVLSLSVLKQFLLIKIIPKLSLVVLLSLLGGLGLFLLDLPLPFLYFLILVFNNTQSLGSEVVPHFEFSLFVSRLAQIFLFQLFLKL